MTLADQRPAPLQDGFGPPVTGGSRRRPRRSAMRRAPTILLALVLGLIAIAAALAAVVSAKIDREEVTGLASGGAVRNVLVVGSDSREGLTEEQQAELATGSFQGKRTDTIFLLSMSAGRSAILSFPRDLYVTRCDGTQGRINAAYAIGGPSCLVETITQLSGIPVHHYIEVSFLGFVDIVDAVGGVPMCLDQPISDAAAGIDLSAGCQVLDGPSSLGFVRVRKIDDDLKRIERQQAFFGQLAGQIASPSTVANVPRLFSTSSAIAGSLTTDADLGTIELLRLGWSARGLRSGIPAQTVPASGASVGGAAVLQIDEAAAEAVFAEYRDGSAAVVGGEVDPALQPADVEVTVLNGAGVAGLAGQVRDLLIERGFVVVDIGNAPAADRTEVVYPPGKEAEAQLVASQVPGGVPTREAAEGPLRVILGADAAAIAGPG